MRVFSLIGTFLFLGVTTIAQLTIQLNSIPSNTPAGEGIFIAGNFQGWDPGSAAHELQINGNGHYEIILNISAGNMMYKFTRGSWATVEGGENGGFLPDRSFAYDGTPQTLVLDILSWEDVGGTNSTAAENVSIIDTDFYMPQLDRYRRVWVYLPPDYSGSSQHYPVMYMHDGQNVFDDATSFSGEWHVDETLNELHADGDNGIIVVAIDNGGADRIDEYSPWVNPTYGGGQGALYMDFIVNTLKPHIDGEYRTLPGRQNTALMGSSLGGLISHYAAVEHEEVFSKVGIFSPSYWFSSEAYSLVSNGTHDQDMRIYMIAGEMEGGETVADAQQMIDTFGSAGYDTEELNLQVHADGQHSEWYWAREFEDAYLWLFAGNQTGFDHLDFQGAISVRPNPMGENGVLDLSGIKGSARMELIDSSGSVVRSGIIPPRTTSYEFNKSDLKPGAYILRVISENHIREEKILIK